MSKKNFFICLLLLLTFALKAQLPCGVVHFWDKENKLRMLENRSAGTSALQRTAGGPIYIPVTIHLIGNSSGIGHADPKKAVRMICKLNTDFADQNIVFYLNGQIRYINDDFLFSDSYDWSVMSGMQGYKVNNTMNIFVNANSSQPVAGYYSPFHDFIFMQNGYANGNSTTITHETGHFFTLPHTFYGWEDVYAPSLYGLSPSPLYVNGQEVEFFARTNCYTGGDGFCDTEADYLSFRYSCPFNSPVLDPSGVPTQANPSYYMSYSSDQCMNNFSTEQKAAILLDITNRNWLNLPAPTQTQTLNTDSSRAIQPLDQSLVSLNSTNIRFEWDTTGASTAQQWLFVLERTLFGAVVEIPFQTVVLQDNFVNVPSQLLIANRDYQWSVLPSSDGYVCANVSRLFKFRTNTTTDIEEQAISSFHSFLLKNPVGSQEDIQFSILSATDGLYQIQLYDAVGHSIFQDEINHNGRSQNYSIRSNDLSTGIYFLHIKNSFHSQVLKISFN